MNKTTIIVISLLALIAVIFGGKYYMDNKNQAETPQMTHQQMVDFVHAHQEKILANEIKSAAQDGYKVESIQIIDSSVRSASDDAGPLQAKGLISFDYTINDNPNYKAEEVTIAGPFYSGNLVVGEDNRPAKVGDVPATYYWYNKDYNSKLDKSLEVMRQNNE